MCPAILFDLDDTLYPYNQFMLGGYRSAARIALRYLDVDEKLFFQMCLQEWRRQGHSGKIFNRVLNSLGMPDWILPHLVNAFRDHNPKLHLFPDANWFLNILQGKLDLGIITDGLAPVQRRKIEALNIARYFKVIICTGDYGRENWKPSLLPYQEALKKLGSPPPERVVYIGDNPYKDFAGAKVLGIYTLRLLRGPFRYIQVSPQQDAHVVVSSFKEISACIPWFPIAEGVLE